MQTSANSDSFARAEENDREKFSRKKAHPEKYINIEYVTTTMVMHRWFSGRIVPCHNIDSCSIPGQGHLLSAHEKSETYYHRIAEKNAHADENVHAENAHAEKNTIIENVPISFLKHWWFSGRIVA